MVKERCSPHGWTVDTLEKYLSDKINNLGNLVEEHEKRALERATSAKEAVSYALSAADKALVKAETAAEKRFESVNEFRSTLSDQAANFVPRGEIMAKFEALEHKELQGFSRSQMFVVAAAAVMSALISAGALIVTFIK